MTGWNGEQNFKVRGDGKWVYFLVACLSLISNAAYCSCSYIQKYIFHSLTTMLSSTAHLEDENTQLFCRNYHNYQSARTDNAARGCLWSSSKPKLNKRQTVERKKEEKVHRGQRGERGWGVWASESSLFWMQGENGVVGLWSSFVKRLFGRSLCQPSASPFSDPRHQSQTALFKKTIVQFAFLHFLMRKNIRRRSWSMKRQSDHNTISILINTPHKNSTLRILYWEVTRRFCYKLFQYPYIK